MLFYSGRFLRLSIYSTFVNDTDHSSDEPMVVLDAQQDWRFAKNVSDIQLFLQWFLTRVRSRSLPVNQISGSMRELL